MIAQARAGVEQEAGRARPRRRRRARSCRGRRRPSRPPMRSAAADVRVVAAASLGRPGVVGAERRRDLLRDGERVDDRGQLDEPGLVVGGRRARCCEDEAGLADAAWADHGDEAAARRRRRPARPGRRRGRRTRSSPPGGAAGGGDPEVRRRRQRGVVGEHGPLEGLQLGPGLDPHLLDEDGAGVAVGAQRVALATAAVQGGHQLGVEALPQRVGVDEGDQRRAGRPRGARRRARRRSARCGRRAPARRSARRRCGRSRGRAARRAPALGPARRRGGTRRPRRSSSPSAAAVTSGGDVAIETMDVDVGDIDVEHIAGRSGAARRRDPAAGAGPRSAPAACSSGCAAARRPTAPRSAGRR